MSESTLALRVRLGNVQAWLNLSENPLHCAQLATVDVLKEVWDRDDRKNMVTATDLAQAVNHAMVWCIRAHSLVLNMLAGSKAPVEVVTPSERKPSSQLNCTVCDAEFWKDEGNADGELCPRCGEGTLSDGIPF